jgi:hypothetical protein
MFTSGTSALDQSTVNNSWDPEARFLPWENSAANSVQQSLSVALHTAPKFRFGLRIAAGKLIILYKPIDLLISYFSRSELKEVPEIFTVSSGASAANIEIPTNSEDSANTAGSVSETKHSIRPTVVDRMSKDVRQSLAVSPTYIPSVDIIILDFSVEIPESSESQAKLLGKFHGLTAITKSISTAASLEINSEQSSLSICDGSSCLDIFSLPFVFMSAKETPSEINLSIRSGSWTLDLTDQHYHFLIGIFVGNLQESSQGSTKSIFTPSKKLLDTCK